MFDPNGIGPNGFGPNEVDILARTIYGEARGEYGHVEGGMAALIAVGNVVMNRLKAGNGYGKTIHEVCLKPHQFSCWNVGDPNRALLMREDISDPVFTVCRHVATKVAFGGWPDLTKGSDHYHALSVSASWARGQKPKLRIANHVFYQLTPRKQREG
jgi:spore germination cell wall hydrolase CwlJ-like protein